MRVGVLALQGGFAAHIQKFSSLGVSAFAIRSPAELSACTHFVMPGGESSTLLKLMEGTYWFDAIADFARAKKPIFGTCAGMILMAETVTPDQGALGLVDISVERNAYGRQIDSFIAAGLLRADIFPVTETEMVFIRAPKVTAIGQAVRVLGDCREMPVLLQQDNCLAASFHPELSRDTTIERYFLDLAKDTA